MLDRLMIFIDGSNYLVELGKVAGRGLRADKPDKAALGHADHLLQIHFPLLMQGPKLQLIRAYWFGSYTGNDEDRIEIAGTLRSHGYEPVLFKRRDGREKGVDIALTSEMLVNAFNDNYDIAVLVAGDEDYVGLVSEVKRQGIIVWGTFFENAVSPHLRLVLDHFVPFDTTSGTPNGAIIDNLRRVLGAPNRPA